MSNAHEAIAAETYDTFADAFLARYRTTDERVRTAQRAKWMLQREGRPE
jgi:hypothetical protein